QGLRMVNVVLELEFFQDGNAKRGRFAGAGAGLTDDVDSLKRKRNEPRLNRRGILVSGLLEGVEHHVRQAKAFESGLRSRAVLQNWLSKSVRRAKSLRGE